MRSAAYQQQQRRAAGRLLLYGCGGFFLGGLLGYLFMSGVHALLLVQAHHRSATEGPPELLGHEGAASQPRPTPHRGLPESPPQSQALQSLADEARAGRGGRAGLPLPVAAGRAKGQAAQARPLGKEGMRGDPLGGAAAAQRDTAIHTIVTSNGSPYLNFQNRIMYATFKLAQRQPGGEGLVAFTRILHRTQPDLLMARGEVPSFRADPLTPACDTWCEFPVSDRPNAVAQFLAAARADPALIQAPWLLMTETDYVWAKPLVAPPAGGPARPQAFPFNYIVPTHPDLEGVIRRMYPASLGPISNIPGTGPAPVLMRVADWHKVTPTWERLTAHIEADPESKQRLGWVREMYAFSIAAALEGIVFDLPAPPASPLLSQPPADHTLGEAAIWHYTWGTLVRHQNDSKVWDFDKRFYTEESIQRKTPHIPLPPPFDPAWKLLNGPNVTRPLYDNLVVLINRMNAAVDTLPELAPLS